MNILFISFNIPWKGGGTFYRALGFARGLVARGHQVTLLATSAAQKWRFEERRQDGVRIVLSPSLVTGKLRTGWDLTEAVRRYRWIKGQPRYDLIHAFESRPTVILPALWASRQMNCKLVIDWCDLFGTGGAIEQRPPAIRAVLRPVETYFENHFRDRAAQTTVINRFLRERAIGLGIPPEAIHLLPNGVDLQAIIPTSKQEARERLQLPAGRPLIGYVGNSYPDDAALMFDALRALLKISPKAKLLLIGNHKIPARLMTGLENHILHSGFVPEGEFKWYLGGCDLMWLLQRDTIANRGRFSMKVTDYMAAGRPTVGTGVGDVADLFDPPDPIGRLVSENAEEIARTTADLLGDSAAQQTLGCNARRRAERSFGWDHVTAGLVNFYQEGTV